MERLAFAHFSSVDFRFANEIGSASYIGCRSFFYLLEIYMFLDVDLTHIDPLHNNTVQKYNLYHYPYVYDFVYFVY